MWRDLFSIFIYLPIKWMIILLVLTLVYYLLTYAFNFLKKAAKILYKFGMLFVACCQIKNPCVLKLFGTKLPDVFKLFAGLLSVILAFVYIIVFILILIGAVLCLVPLNFIIPNYHSI